MTEVYKGLPIEPMYEVWKAQEDKKAESHRKKLERDRKAKERYREKNRERLNQEAKEYYRARNERVEA
jgi:hypothetical protein